MNFLWLCLQLLKRSTVEVSPFPQPGRTYLVVNREGSGADGRNVTTWYIPIGR
jgi:hypothetical protein